MADDAEPIRFRTTKKRKAYRQRPTPDDITPTPPLSYTPPPIAEPPLEQHEDDADDDDEDEDADADATDEAQDSSAAAAALRLRTSHRAARLRGMGFKSDAPPSASARGKNGSQSQALVPRDAELPPPAQLVDAGGVDGRFMHQTGLLTILDDVHMNEFIEARLASRNAATHPAPKPPLSNENNHDPPAHDGPDRPVPGAEGEGSSSTPLSRAKDHQPARQGKLFEVAIPEDVRKQDPLKRRRVDKDKRAPARTSDDIQRDAMVDQFLHENKLDVYDVAEASTSRYAPGKDFSADARLADQFRRQYYEDLALRRKKRRPALSKKEQQQQRAAQASEVLKGPKLGGSRNQRAAIRNILLQQQGEKKA